MAELRYDVDKLFANPYSKVLIYTPKGTVKGFLQEPFVIGGTSEFNSAFESSLQNKLSEQLNAGKLAMNSLFGTKFAQTQMKSLMQTIASWTGSQKPTFSLNLFFPAYRPDHDCTTFARILLRGVYPTGKNILKAPYDYAPEALEEPDGTCTVKIGLWFEAQYQILRTVTMTASKECMESGNPLYCEVAITFEPFRMINAEELTGYWQVPGKYNIPG